MIKRIIFAIAAVLFIASCKGAGDEVVKPSISLQPGKVTDNSLAFDVTVTNASAAAYLCVAESSKTPIAEEVLRKGTAVKIGNKVTQTVYTLNYNTTYNVVVAATDKSDNLVLETLSMTTAEQATGVVLKAKSTTYKTFVFTITPANADQVWYKIYKDGETATDADIMATGVSVSTKEVTEITLTPEKGTYFIAAVAKKGSTVVRAKDIDFVIAGAEILSVNVKRVEYKDYGTDMEFSIYLNDSDVNLIRLDCYYHEGATSVGGTYTYSPSANPPAGSVAHSYSYVSLLTTTKKFFTAGTVEVENLGNNQYKLIVKMTRDDEKVYDFTWTGTAQERQY